MNLDATHLTPKQVAARLQLSVNTLANLRCTGNGPPYMKLGNRVRYPIRELEAWESERLRQNTAQR